MTTPTMEPIHPGEILMLDYLVTSMVLGEGLF